MARAPTKPDRGVPPLPPTPLAALADDEPLPVRAVAAYARKSVVAVQCWKRHNTHPELVWQGSGRQGCRAFLLAGDLKRFLAAPPPKRPRARPKPGFCPPRPDLPLEALAPDARLSTIEVAGYLGLSIDVVRQRRSQGTDAPLVWLRDGQTKTVSAADLVQYLPVCRPMAKRVSGGRRRKPARSAGRPPTPPARRSPPAPRAAAPALVRKVNRTDTLSEWDVLPDLQLAAPRPPRKPNGAAPPVRSAVPRRTGPKVLTKPIIVAGRRLTRVSEIAAVLCNGWPAQGKGSAYKQALVCARDCIANLAEPEAVRAAFIAAAREAGVSVKR